MTFEKKDFKPGDKLSADFMNYLQSMIGEQGLIVVTLNEDETEASHSSTEIMEHIAKGGFAVLEVGSPVKAYAYPYYWHDSFVWFSLIEVVTGVTQTIYAIFDDKHCTIETMTPDYGEGGSVGEVSQIDLSNFENGSYTEKVNGNVITHTVTFDEQGRPTAIDDVAIVWGSA